MILKLPKSVGSFFCAMVFSSTLFLFYFLPGFLLLYYTVPDTVQKRGGSTG